VWNNSELVDGYWASAKGTPEDSFRVVDEVRMVIQMADVIPIHSLIRAELDIERPSFYFIDIQGEYGAAFRLAALQEFERQKEKCSSDPASFGSIFSDIAQVVQGAAQTGLLGKTAKTIGDTQLLPAIAGIFGLSNDEPFCPEVDIAFQGTLQAQPFTKILGVYDQGLNSTCVLCSIGHAISMIAPPEVENPLEQINKSLATVLPASLVPEGGLNITDSLKKLEGVLSNYNLGWRRMTPNVTNIKNALDNGIPVIAGMFFDNQIYSYKTNPDPPISGPTFTRFGVGQISHCVTIVAYDDADSTFTMLNSYSSTWGRNGAMFVEQEYRGIDRTFILEIKPSNFQGIDIAQNLPSIRYTS